MPKVARQNEFGAGMFWAVGVRGGPVGVLGRPI